MEAAEAAECEENMNLLSPSILAADCARLGEQIEKIQKAGAQYLHIDVMDGMFVPSLSFGMCVISSLRKVSDLTFDVHLMVEEPTRYVADFAKSGADIITVHLEACSNVEETLEWIHSLGRRAGLSIKPSTPVSAVEPYLNKIDMLLVMTVEPGFGGQKYLPASTERIREARRLIQEKGLNVDIEVDGGITKENVSTVLEAGANVVVAGSAIFRGDIEENVRDMMEKMK